MSEPRVRWSESVGRSLDDPLRDHLENRLDLYFHGVNSLGASTIAHRFITESDDGSAVLRAVKQGAANIEIELVEFNQLRLDDAAVSDLLDQVRLTLESVPQTSPATTEADPAGAGFVEAPTRRAVRRALRRVATVGAEPSWIRETARALTQFRYVQVESARLELSDEIARADLARQMLRDAAERLEPRTRTIVVVVLALDTRYEKVSLRERRAIAGRALRGGRRSWGTIRSHYEPLAFDELTDALFELDKHQADPRTDSRRKMPS